MKKRGNQPSNNDLISLLFREFYDSEKAGGFILILCTVLSVILANISFQDTYADLWHTKIAGFDLQHLINDGLMTIFFLLIGLELEREIYIGELSNIRNALFPVSAALGGMLIPALLYLTFNMGTDTQSGIGIPMATDIAFAIGILSLLGKKVPLSLKIFLTALAIVDDLGAIIIIALFYSKTIVLTNLIVSLGIFGALLILNRTKVHHLLPYIIGGIGMWYFMSKSGIHATISGVMLAFAVPFDRVDLKSPSYLLQHWLHKPVAFFILPVFALSNTAIPIQGNIPGLLLQPYGLGILAGLTIGKPLGITLFGFLAVKLGLCRLPDRISWKHIIGTGFLAGIGFTMSIFITLLAFDDASTINNAKLVILIASLVSGTIGYFTLKNIFVGSTPARPD
jgi:NhaA family Na+:H+ antiporter